MTNMAILSVYVCVCVRACICVCVHLLLLRVFSVLVVEGRIKTILEYMKIRRGQVRF
jgi:hypothetical protein